MGEHLQRWRRDPSSFVEEMLHDPETGRPFELLEAERRFLEHAFLTDAAGRLLYPEQVYAAPKKSGKTGFAALMTLTAVLVFGGPYAEGYALANDKEQSTARVFEAIRRIVERSPNLKRLAKVTQDRVFFPDVGSFIQAIANDYAGAAGANPTISTFDELWAFTSERSHRLWDEMVPPPTRKIAMRFTTTYAGFEGESELLEGLYKRGLRQPTVGDDLRAGEWNSIFSSKFDYAGGLLGGPLGLMASSALGASFNMACGTAPVSPNNGDIWCTPSGLFVQIAGATIGPLGTGGGGGGGSSLAVDVASARHAQPRRTLRSQPWMANQNHARQAGRFGRIDAGRARGGRGRESRAASSR